MQNDLFLVVGVIILVFTVPAIVSAFSEGRPPRIAAIMLLISGGLIAIALTQKPGGYSFEDIPQAFVRVIGHYLR
ncbi:hypothetical protein [Sinisalibacter aestuarii]|uniref:50S ribosomal protein L35 n=1 Tax=Sinisalibacter aestuarii TaxID=2949426 RepID=A0ABQ5LRN6_9RHOB|nr:hypothetical protein [Sinisalibacter aestuarii]GKY86946.1 hypothetical protein STA1M1_08150 [Sinisalibacter aestuarii]